jgi:hypothetical protein
MGITDGRLTDSLTARPKATNTFKNGPAIAKSRALHGSDTSNVPATLIV